MGQCVSKQENTETKDTVYSLPDKDYNEELKVLKQFPIRNSVQYPEQQYSTLYQNHTYSVIYPQKTLQIF